MAILMLSFVTAVKLRRYFKDRTLFNTTRMTSLDGSIGECKCFLKSILVRFVSIPRSKGVFFCICDTVGVMSNMHWRPVNNYFIPHFMYCIVKAKPLLTTALFLSLSLSLSVLCHIPVIPNATQWKPITNYITATYNIYFIQNPNTIHISAHGCHMQRDQPQEFNIRLLFHDHSLYLSLALLLFVCLCVCVYHLAAANLSDPLQIMNVFALLKVSCCWFGSFFFLCMCLIIFRIKLYSTLLKVRDWLCVFFCCCCCYYYWSLLNIWQ